MKFVNAGSPKTLNAIFSERLHKALRKDISP